MRIKRHQLKVAALHFQVGLQGDGRNPTRPQIPPAQLQPALTIRRPAGPASLQREPTRQSVPRRAEQPRQRPQLAHVGRHLKIERRLPPGRLIDRQRARPAQVQGIGLLPQHRLVDPHPPPCHAQAECQLRKLRLPPRKILRLQTQRKLTGPRPCRIPVESQLGHTERPAGGALDAGEFPRLLQRKIQRMHGSFGIRRSGVRPIRVEVAAESPCLERGCRFGRRTPRQRIDRHILCQREICQIDRPALPHRDRLQVRELLAPSTDLHRGCSGADQTRSPFVEQHFRIAQIHRPVPADDLHIRARHLDESRPRTSQPTGHRCPFRRHRTRLARHGHPAAHTPQGHTTHQTERPRGPRARAGAENPHFLNRQTRPVWRRQFQPLDHQRTKKIPAHFTHTDFATVLHTPPSHQLLHRQAGQRSLHQPSHCPHQQDSRHRKPPPKTPRSREDWPIGL